jgi:hypothetical protein
LDFATALDAGLGVGLVAGFLAGDVLGDGLAGFFVEDFFGAGFTVLPTGFFFEAGAGFLGVLAMVIVG